LSKEGQGSPDQKPKYLFIRPPQEQEGAQKEKKANNSLVSPVEQKISDKSSPTPESKRAPQQEQATGGTESPEAGPKDKPPLKRRRSLAFISTRISDELLRISENKKP